MKSLIGIAVMMHVTALQTAASVPAKQLAPSSKWNVDFGEDICVLLRNFGDGPDRITIGFKPSPMNDSLRVVVLSQGGPGRPASGIANIGFGPPHKNKDVVFLAGRSTSGQIAVLTMGRADLEPLMAGAPLALSVGNRLHVAVRMDGFREAMKILEACEFGLLKIWGMAPDSITAISKKPSMIKGTGAKAEDYPLDAAASGKQGTAGARLSLDASGRAIDCKIIETTGHPVLDQQTCKVFRRARFQPALDGQGRPVPTLIYSLMTWQVRHSGFDYVESSPPATVPVIN